MIVDRVAVAAANARAALLARRNENGAFCGRLSSSALSTATAAIALAGSPHATDRALAARGRAWLRAHQNEDGGFGDTAQSPANISTTTLAWASLGLGLGAEQRGVAATRAAFERAERWLWHACGELTPERLAAAIRARYGRDHTFSVPILTACAIAGRLGSGRDAWRLVPALPFELAACPPAWFRFLQMPTVSYALPALIAIGQARHAHRPSRNPLARLLRALASERTLRVLASVQPASGGFLEAAPLTSFVAMSLQSIGLGNHAVTARCLGFLRGNVRDDGSWPIDTNLDTWTTTLATEALGGNLDAAGGGRATLGWLCTQQYRAVHPYTQAPPGGWAWTNLSGGVPDADDTAGALLALRVLDAQAVEAASRGIVWLLGLQNRDGGIPTFCRGWGRLPFDRSSPDLTAHALRAFAAWRGDLPAALGARVDRARRLALDYLVRVQRDDGAFVPLWFGNQHAPEQENPLYGTSRVLRALVAMGDHAGATAACERAVAWLQAAQHGSGGFGAAPGVAPTIEETALAVEALAHACGRTEAAELRAAVERGAAWLVEHTDGGTRFAAAPIGLYFAKLWYSEELYPVVFTVAALRAARNGVLATDGLPAGHV